MTCQECHGNKTVTLFTSKDPCQACGGTGVEVDWCTPSRGAFVPLSPVLEYPDTVEMEAQDVQVGDEIEVPNYGFCAVVGTRALPHAHTEIATDEMEPIWVRRTQLVKVRPALVGSAAGFIERSSNEPN